MHIFLLSFLQVTTIGKLGFPNQNLGHPEKVLELVSIISYISILGFLSLNMKNNTKLDENIEGAENFRAWKYKIMLILEVHDLDSFIKEDVKEVEGEEAKAKKKMDTIKVKRIIANSIKDLLIS